MNINMHQSVDKTEYFSDSLITCNILYVNICILYIKSNILVYCFINNIQKY